MIGREKRFLQGTYTPFQMDVVAPMSAQATPSKDTGAASSRKRKGAGGEGKDHKSNSVVYHKIVS